MAGSPLRAPLASRGEPRSVLRSSLRCLSTRTMTPPAAIVNKIKSYDPALRVVWSPLKECWLIERRVRRARLWYGGESQDPDVKRRYLDGYIHVGNVAPRLLDERVLLNLWKNDMWAHGGAKAVNAAMDDYYETTERRDDVAQRDDCRQVAKEMWSYVDWRRRRGASLPERVA
mgnify:FL=1